MRYYEIITEARRNPEQNPKVSTLEALEKYAGRDDVFVSFTSDVGEMSHDGFRGGKNISGSKLGINPKSEYNTPIGIYTYPIDYVLERGGKVPFAAEEPFLYLVQATKPLLDLNNYSETDFKRDSEKLIDMGFKDTQEDGIHGSNFDTPASKLWNWTRLAALKKTAQWPKILRALGYSGAVDHGSKVIHPNEPTQAVFFSTNAIKVLEVIPNRFESKPLKKPISTIKNPSEQAKLIAVTQDGNAIKYIKNPSEELQLAAVQQNGLAIEWIIKKGITPSEKVQLTAVTQNVGSIKYIKNPSEKLQLAAVTENTDTIRWMDNPSEAVQLATVTKSGWAIEWIIKKGITPSEDVKIAAVTQNGFAIKAIDNPSEEVQLAAVKNLATAIQFINNPSEKVRLTAEAIYLAAVKKDSEAIRVINNPSEQVQIAAVTKNGWAIKWIIENGITPSEQVQIAAVQQDRNAIHYIKNPSEAVKKAAGL